jgi:hypothetical protein
LERPFKRKGEGEEEDKRGEIEGLEAGEEEEVELESEEEEEEEEDDEDDKEPKDRSKYRKEFLLEADKWTTPLGKLTTSSAPSESVSSLPVPLSVGSGERAEK